MIGDYQRHSLAADSTPWRGYLYTINGASLLLWFRARIVIVIEEDYTHNPGQIFVTMAN